MPCLICGDDKTVRSHILPKALIHDLKEGASHVISGSRWHKGAKPSAAGRFSDDMLCSEHEAATSALDTYGVRFVREVRRTYEAGPLSKSLEVTNPNPRMLSRFALSLIWREAHNPANVNARTSLASYDAAVSDAVFADGDIDWPMLVSQSQFSLGEQRAIQFALHPYRVRLMERNAWSFTLLGVTFWLVSDSRGLPVLPDWLRANVSDPATIVVGHQQDFRTVGNLQALLSNMGRRGRPG